LVILYLSEFVCVDKKLQNSITKIVLFLNCCCKQKDPTHHHKHINDSANRNINMNSLTNFFTKTTRPKAFAQVFIFAGIVGAAYLANRTQGAAFDKPKTNNPEVHAIEHETYLFQGDKRDMLMFNYAKNSHRQFPKFDTRDESEEKLYLPVNKE
jgi:hypothetical protein